MVAVDTHIIIWDALDPGKLSKKARKAFDNANETDGILICDISLWEISMLMQKKCIQVDATYLEFIGLIIVSRNYIIQSITPEIADISTKLITDISTDPADGIISATSIHMNVPLITADKYLRNSGVLKTIW
jgi:PIN domain nuclease of toxin-antitoxin system